MGLQRFSWKDRDTAARDMIQLVYHGPEYVRQLAFEVLEAIRSTAVVSELKAIGLDPGLSYQERSAALNALAACPGDISIEELAPFVKTQFDGRWNTLKEARGASTYELNTNQLSAEFSMLMSIFKVIGAQASNRRWFFELLDQTAPTMRCDVLCEAINATCQQELEPILIGQLTELIEQYPEFFTLKTANEIANHSDEEPPKFLIDHIDKIISLCLEGSENEVSSVLSYSPALTAKVAETHLELAKLSSVFTTSPEPDNLVAPLPKLWRQMVRVYQKAASGDKKAFMQLHELPDDYQTNILIQAAATHFLGKLWSHDHVLDRLCELVRDADETWDMKSESSEQTYSPIRFEAALALRQAATPQAWEALVDLKFRQPHYSMSIEIIDWIRELTDLLDGSSKDSDQPQRIYWWRPWIEALGELPDDLDEILRKL
jgi:hypothetical protein